jgi:tetratricopeptide (TPR) repeat protein
MLLKSKAFYIFLMIAIMTSGCAYNVPPVDSAKDNQSQLSRKKMPIKVGMYLSDDLKQYIYQQPKKTSDFQMKIGQYLPKIAMTMGSAMFDDVVSVNALPPYDDSYRPDVEAVIRPEILFCYGNTVGVLAGYLQAKIKLRVTVYGLDGNRLWQDEAIGESRSNDMDYSYLAGMDEPDKTGYQAISSATAHIIDDFHAKPPQELLSLVEIKKAENLRDQGALPDFELFKALYEKGQFQYDKKNYYQSLYLFSKASSLAPDEPAALFYTGASYTHTGDKQRALKQFADLIKKKTAGQQAADAKKWIQRLNDPLKVAIIGGNKADGLGLNDDVIQEALINNGMYKVIDTAKLMPAGHSMTTPEFSQFLDECYKKGVKVVILHDIDSSSEKAPSNHYSGEDVATEHKVRISAKAYSTKKKHLKTEVQIDEGSSTIQGQTAEEETKTRQQLLQSGAKKLVLQLLKNDIF